MKVVGLMPVRNESWCLGLSARVALMWCDELVILDHGSTDGTTELLLELQSEYTIERIRLLFEDDPQWDEMRHRQRMLCTARERGATHITIIDADEILTGNLTEAIGGFCCIKGALETMPRGHILQLPGYNLRGSLNRYHSNGIWGNRLFSVAFADDPRLGWSGDKFHHREPTGAGIMRGYQPIAQGEGGIMHLWGVSERRLKAKHALYAMTERLRWPDKPIKEINRMYGWATKGEPGHRTFGTPDSWTYADVPDSWWAPYAHLMKYLDVDAEPWQTDECIRLMKDHGPRAFEGLDLFGVCG